MPSWSANDLPFLVPGNHVETSPTDGNYNCIAWAANDQFNWWWPGEDGYWPDFAPREETVEAFVAMFRGLGYTECENGELELGFEKVAIYAVRSAGRLEPTHTARQLIDGKWTSKLGPLEDISHDALDGVNGPVYGSAVRYMRRSR